MFAQWYFWRLEDEILLFIMDIASELWILCLTRQDHRIGFSFFVLTSCPYWCWERPGSSAAQTVDRVFMPLWSLLWSNLWNAFLRFLDKVVYEVEVDLKWCWTSCKMRFLWKTRSNRSWVFPLNFQQNILLIFTCICFLILEAFFLCLEVHMTAAVTHSAGTSRPGASEFNQSDWFRAYCRCFMVWNSLHYEMVNPSRYGNSFLSCYKILIYWYTTISLWRHSRNIPRSFYWGLACCSWHFALQLSQSIRKGVGEMCLKSRSLYPPRVQLSGNSGKCIGNPY